MTMNNIEKFLKNSNLEYPLLVMDLSKVSDSYKKLKKASLKIKLLLN